MVTRMAQNRKFSLGFLHFLLMALALCACAPAAFLTGEERMPGGNAARGLILVEEYGCQSCHDIPGVPGHPSYVGPPLTAWAERHYIVGRYPNNAENLALWIRLPQQVEPGTAMPNLDVTEQDALDIGAYLFSLD